MPGNEAANCQEPRESEEDVEVSDSAVEDRHLAMCFFESHVEAS